jgi:hypothetical protein
VIQTQDGCPNGAGDWVFFGVINPVGASTTASIVAFALVIVMGTWQVINVVVAAARLWMWLQQKASPLDIARGSQFPAVIWWIAKLHGKERTLLPQRFRWTAFVVTRFFQLAVVTYVILTVERTVVASGIQSFENQWGFGQIMPMVNLLATAILVSYRLLRFVLLVGFPPKGAI